MEAFLRKVRIRFASEERIVFASQDTTLESVLLAHRLPANLFQGYLINIDASSDWRAIPVPLTLNIRDISPDGDILLRCIRNVGIHQVLPQRTTVERAENPVTFIRDVNFSGGECVETIHEVDSAEAQKIVSKEVSEFMALHSKVGRVVVGISGGGDSNTLVKSLFEFSEQDSRREYICFTLVVEPFWPKSAAGRAAALCTHYGIKHIVLDEAGMERLLGMKGSMRGLLFEFRDAFGINTHNFFATYIISKVARQVCRANETDEYCLGFNREDVLAEVLFSLMNGRAPLAYPVRTFGNFKLLMPLWTVPKKVLDACYPKYSESNYREREQGDEATTLQRSLIFYLSHAVDDVYDNLGMSLMSGVRKVFEGKWPVLQSVERADLYVSPYAEPDKLATMEELISKYF